MRRFESLLIAFAVLACVSVLACSEPTKPVKKLNIKRAADLEPIMPPASTHSDQGSAEEPVTAPAMTSTETMEVVEVEDFRGPCDSMFVGVNQDDLVTVRAGRQIRTHRLAGISIPDDARLAAHNQLRMWMDGKAISVEVDESVPAIDAPAYIRLCPDGAMMNEELVREGLALPANARFRRTDALKKASVEALTAGRGVWGKTAQ